jgi:quaternary ammonium compound-resistance protein SugE
MAWIVLLVSAVFEAVWATALGYSHGLTQPVFTGVFLAGLTVSMLGLGWASKSIPIGTAYAIWTGTGAALTVGYAMLAGDEPISVPKLAFIGGIIAAVAGLKLLPHQAGPPEDQDGGAQ